jgi:hypothetical protein
VKLTVAPRLDNREHGSRVSVVVPSGWPARVRSGASRTSGLRSGREGHADAFGGRGDEGLAFGTRETQGVRQRAHGVRMGSLLSPRSSALTALAVRPALEASPSCVNSAASRERLRRAPKSVVLAPLIAHPIPRSSAVAETLHGGW